MKMNHLLCIDLSTRLQHDALPMAGKTYFGFLECKTPSDSSPYSDEFAFEEIKVSPSVVRRNIYIFNGQHITATRRLTDGTIRLNFKNLKVDAAFNVDVYALEVSNEIREALKAFVQR